MSMLKIDELIKEAIKEKNGSKKEAYRAIKNAFLVFTTAKNAKPLDEAAEVSILKKLVKEREDSISIYEANSRNDLAQIEREQCKYIKELLPEEPTQDEIISVIKSLFDNEAIVIEKKEMGKVIKEVKNKLPSADGKLVSEIVKSYVK